MDKKDDIVMDCKVGRFLFNPVTRLSHAKLVRDTVMGQMLNPVPGFKKVKTDQDARELIQSCTGTFSLAPFEFQPS